MVAAVCIENERLDRDKRTMGQKERAKRANAAGIAGMQRAMKTTIGRPADGEKSRGEMRIYTSYILHRSPSRPSRAKQRKIEFQSIIISLHAASRCGFWRKKRFNFEMRLEIYPVNEIISHRKNRGRYGAIACSWANGMRRDETDDEACFKASSIWQWRWRSEHHISQSHRIASHHVVEKTHKIQRWIPMSHPYIAPLKHAHASPIFILICGFAAYQYELAGLQHPFCVHLTVSKRPFSLGFDGTDAGRQIKQGLILAI